MANTPGSKKRARQIVRRTEVNKARKSRIRTFVRKVDEALESRHREMTPVLPGFFCGLFSRSRFGHVVWKIGFR